MDNDDYTAKMTELIRLMRAIGNDTQQCEVKECAHKISTTITELRIETGNRFSRMIRA